MRKTIVFAALAAACFQCLAARPLLPSGQGDQVPTQLTALPAPTGEFERKPVNFSWALDPGTPLSAPSPHQARSREYWQSVDAAELRQGVSVRFSAPGALVRVSPAGGAAPLAPSGLTLRDSANRPARLQSVADAQQLQAAGMAVERGTLVARLAPQQAAGDYRLSVPAAAGGRYLVHVFEPHSDVVLTAQARTDRAFAGSLLAVDLGILRGHATLPGMQAEAMLVAPDGRSFPAQVKAAAGGRMTASARIPQVAPKAAGLWELHVFANAQGIQRDARTAFAVVQPTARFDGTVDIDADALRVALPVQAASRGRYEVRGTLLATGPDRVLHPIAQAHSAAWLDRPRGVLVLDFEQAQVPAGFGAPYELRQLELHDQTRMMPLEVRMRALRF